MFSKPKKRAPKRKPKGPPPKTIEDFRIPRGITCSVCADTRPPTQCMVPYIITQPDTNRLSDRFERSLDHTDPLTNLAVPTITVPFSNTTLIDDRELPDYLSNTKNDILVSTQTPPYSVPKLSKRSDILQKYLDEVGQEYLNKIEAAIAPVVDNDTGSGGDPKKDRIIVTQPHRPLHDKATLVVEPKNKIFDIDSDIKIPKDPNLNIIVAQDGKAFINTYPYIQTLPQEFGEFKVIELGTRGAELLQQFGELKRLDIGTKGAELLREFDESSKVIDIGKDEAQLQQEVCELEVTDTGTIEAELQRELEGMDIEIVEAGLSDDILQIYLDGISPKGLTENENPLDSLLFGNEDLTEAILLQMEANEDVAIVDGDPSKT